MDNARRRQLGGTQPHEDATQSATPQMWPRHACGATIAVQGRSRKYVALARKCAALATDRGRQGCRYE